MGTSDLPLVQELLPAPAAEEAFARLHAARHCLFLDSASRDSSLGRYSFLAVDPFDFRVLPVGAARPLEPLAAALARWVAATAPDLPPFQGGAAGLWSYELGRSFERVPSARIDDFPLPAIAVGFYDVVLAFDHSQERAWIVSQGFPETEPSRRRRRAAARLRQLRRWLAGQEDCAAANASFGGDVPAQALAPRFAVETTGRLCSNFSREAYLQAVTRVLDYIRAGDVFQVNLAQRLLCPAQGDAVSLYGRLRRCNPSPFGGYFDLGAARIISASPERFFHVTEGEVETRPIKGTRRRQGNEAADAALAAQLRASEKDRAENVMIVDLLRNDLGRVCQPGSIRVSQLCEVETYEHVLHLVSAVRGRLRPGLHALDLLRAAFPGGSVTGAPKIRAMEIIAELEPTTRGAYCGSLGYIGFDGTADFNLLIRTITDARGWWQMPVGGGIVADSDPVREYQETWDKAEGLLRAL